MATRSIATRSGEILFTKKGSVHMNSVLIHTTRKQQSREENSQPMFITRHPRHRTGVHTCAVKTGSGTPGPPYHRGLGLFSIQEKGIFNTRYHYISSYLLIVSLCIMCIIILYLIYHVPRRIHNDTIKRYDDI